MSTKAYAVKFQRGEIDKVNGVIKSVSVITEGLAQGHGEFVDSLTLQQVKAAAETYSSGLKVVDRHTRGTDSIFATVGVLRNFRIEGKQLKADLHVLKSEAGAEKLFEMADTMPDTFGLSIAFSGPQEKRDGITYSRCTEIYNAALVDVPAANPTGLFSAAQAEVKVALVDATSSATMNPDEVRKIVNEAVVTALSEYGVRVKKIEDAFAGFKPASQDEFSALKNQVTELSKNLDTAKTELTAKVVDRSGLAQEIAKEFAKHTGASTGVVTDGQTTTGTADPKAALDAFVQKEFAASKNKVEAIKAAHANTEFSALLRGGYAPKWA